MVIWLCGNSRILHRIHNDNNSEFELSYIELLFPEKKCRKSREQKAGNLKILLNKPLGIGMELKRN